MRRQPAASMPTTSDLEIAAYPAPATAMAAVCARKACQLVRAQSGEIGDLARARRTKRSCKETVRGVSFVLMVINALLNQIHRLYREAPTSMPMWL